MKCYIQMTWFIWKVFVDFKVDWDLENVFDWNIYKMARKVNVYGLVAVIRV